MLAKLCTEMAELTHKYCPPQCGRCCHAIYCDAAKARMVQLGMDVTGLPAADATRPYLHASGKCLVPPQARALCTVHQCEIASVGIFRKSAEDTARYFELREQICELEEAQAVTSQDFFEPSV